LTDQSPDPTATCLGCGCACDDIEIAISANRIIRAERACALGEAWFGDGSAPAGAIVRGQETSAEDALDAAAALLRDARRPFVFVAPDATCEAQREAVALADVLRASLDSVTSATVMNVILAAQERGRASATLGEARNRADLVIFWGVDPGERYPRFAERYVPDPPGIHVPEGRRSRDVVAVDIGERRGPADVAPRVVLRPEDEVMALRTLAAGVHNELSESMAPLATLIARARYTVIVADAEPGSERAAVPGRADALATLSQALNGAGPHALAAVADAPATAAESEGVRAVPPAGVVTARGALVTLRAGGNRSGADAVFTWQTGYPMAIDFSRGYPQYGPHGGSAGSRLGAGLVDALVIVGAEDRIPEALRLSMAEVPGCAIGPRATSGPRGAERVAIDTGIAGIHDAGTAMRMDDVALPLRRLVTGLPETAATVRALRERLTRGGATGATARRIGAQRS
jgi:formylmethanofuran dehydrogenase subunit B